MKKMKKMNRFLMFLFFPLSCFSQDWVLGVSNQFNFAVGLEYDVEQGVIEQGVFGGLTNWTGSPYEITEGLLDVEHYSVWTNYPTNGVPSEVLSSLIDSSITTNSSSEYSRFGLDGLQTSTLDDTSGKLSVYLPLMTGSGTQISSSRKIEIIGYPSASDLITSTQLRYAFRVHTLPDGFLKNLYSNLVGGIYDLLLAFDPLKSSIRNFIGSCCTSIAALHLLWISAVVGSGLFRAIVAGITGIASGGK